MFQTLRWRLLLSYVSVMVAILGISTVAVYEFVAYRLYQKLDNQMVTLADAAAHSLLDIKANPKAIDSRAKRSLDYDNDLDIPWQDLHKNHQGVEWFDANGQLLGEAGNYMPNMPFVANVRTYQQKNIRSITLPIYLPTSVRKKELQGYVRVSESTEELSEELDRLMWGFGCGGLVAVILSGVGGWWLTRQSLKPIEQSFQQLKQFTADASHELRSPLTAVKTSIEVMMNHPERIHPADVKKLKAIAEASNQMTRLVEDLLLLARTDATSKTPLVECISIPLDELLEDLVDLLQPQAEAKKITLKLDSSNEVFVKGNANQLKRLFANLLENALQYTQSSGSVKVVIMSLERFVVINIEDTGVGIESEHIPLVFHRFWRADKARSRREGGMGLGLAIAQAIAQQHKGEITLSSQVGVGSCFQVRLPVAL